MRRLRPEERFACACLDAALQDAEVRQHDDGSEDGMFDLEVIRDGRRIAAVEVTQATEEQPTELWEIVNPPGGGRGIEPQLVGGWMVALFPDTRVKELRPKLLAFLKQLEDEGVRAVGPGRAKGRLERMAHRLGIAHLTQNPTAFPGSVYTTIDHESGGWVAETGDAFVPWFEEWIGQPEHADNLAKLREADAPERHLFLVFPGFAEAPFEVSDLFMRTDTPLPVVHPRLPPELTHLWVASIWDTGLGVRWSPDVGWEHFDKPPGTAP